MVNNIIYTVKDSGRNSLYKISRETKSHQLGFIRDEERQESIIGL